MAISGEVEQVPGDDQDPGPVPGVQRPGELSGDGQRRGCGVGGKEEVAHDHDPSPERHVDPRPARFRGELLLLS